MIINVGNQYSIGTIDASYDKLPKGTYVLKFNPMKGYYLEKTQDFTLPTKLYGDMSISERWLKAYEHSTNGVSILLSGVKGTGKTVLGKKTAIDSGKPIIVVNTYYDQGFVDFVMKPEFSDSVIMIDEFEKIFPEGSSEVLSLLDGSLKSKLLCILTCNEMNRISTYCINRPGRIRYNVDYRQTPSDVLHAIVEDMLVDKTKKDNLIKEFKSLSVRTNDVLIAIIQDMNLFNDTATNVVKTFFLQPAPARYSVSIKTKGDFNHIATVNIESLDSFDGIYTSAAFSDEDALLIESEFKAIKSESIEKENGKSKYFITLSNNNVDPVITYNHNGIATALYNFDKFQMKIAQF